MTGLAEVPVTALATGVPSLLMRLEGLGAPLVHARTAPFPGDHVTLGARSAERMLTVAGARDVVCLPAAPDPTFVAWLAELGLAPELDRIVVPAGAPTAPLGPRFLADPGALRRVASLLPADGAAWLSPIVSAPDDAPLAAAIAAVRRAPVRVLAGHPTLVARVDHKPVVRAAALELGVPVADGTVVTLALDADGRHTDLGPLQQAIRAFSSSSGRAIVRGAAGVGGSSVFVTGPEGFTGAAGEAFAARPAQSVYLVEEHLSVLASPNVQVFIDPATGAARCVSVADQLLTPTLGYRGNAYPSAAETAPAMVAASLRMASWLSREGYRGILGLDFVEYADAAGRPRFVLAEINPRFNGASQAVAMLERLNRQRQAAGRPPIGGFAGGVVPTRARTVSELLQRLGSRRYDPSSGCGVLPFHTAGLPDGVCGLVVFAGSRADAVHAFEELEAEGKGASHG